MIYPMVDQVVFGPFIPVAAACDSNGNMLRADRACHACHVRWQAANAAGCAPGQGR